MHIFCKVYIVLVPHEISRHWNDIKLTWHILNGLERGQLISLNMKRNCWAGVLHRSQGDCLFCIKLMWYKTENVTIEISWYVAWKMVNKEKAWLWMHVFSVSWTKAILCIPWLSFSFPISLPYEVFPYKSCTLRYDLSVYPFSKNLCFVSAGTSKMSAFRQSILAMHCYLSSCIAGFEQRSYQTGNFFSFQLFCVPKET